MQHFVVRFSKFSSPQAARGHWPPITRILQTPLLIDFLFFLWFLTGACVCCQRQWSWARRSTGRTWPDPAWLFSARPRAIPSRPSSGRGCASTDRWSTCPVSNLPFRHNCFNPTTSYRPLICYWLTLNTVFSNLFYMSIWYNVTVPTLELVCLYNILR